MCVWVVCVGVCCVCGLCVCCCVCGVDDVCGWRKEGRTEWSVKLAEA